VHPDTVEIGCQHGDVAHRVRISLMGQRITAEKDEVGGLARGQ